MKPRRRPPKIITRVIVFLLLGAIVNVAVAWGCIAISRQWSPAIPVDVPTAEQIRWWQHHLPKVDLAGMYNSSSLGVVMEFFYGDNATNGVIAERIRAGFPSLSLVGVNWFDRNGDFFASTFFDFGVISLPYHPVFSGFAINTIFYTAILWLLFFAPGSVRRAFRRRRGLCPACAYPIGISPVCTECGNAVTSRKEAAPDERAGCDPSR